MDMIKSIDAEELKQKIDQNEKLILVDCREPNEWEAGHIEQAKLIPLSEFETRYEELTDKNAQIIMQCRSGKRSMRACEFLEAQGYTNLTNLEGGILGWEDEGFSTIS